MAFIWMVLAALGIYYAVDVLNEKRIAQEERYDGYYRIEYRPYSVANGDLKQ